jgi:serine/threonine-protein kinase
LLDTATTRTATDVPSFQTSELRPLDDARFAPGHIFAARFRIVSPLGRGAMGEVYRADDLRLGQPVAIKLMTFDRVDSSDAFRRFLAEVRLARGIAHPNVCRVYDIGEAQQWHYLSMEYVDGETLASLLRRIGRLPPEKTLDIARQLLAGLAAAHDRGVLHRDLKPSNIMIDGRGRVRIMDFGLAVSTADGPICEIAGTPAYMAPEQLIGDRVTERTDLYALGLVLYEVFAGHPLFAVRTVPERLHLQRNEHPPALGPDIDPRVAAIIRACLEEDPEARPRTALTVAAMFPGGDPLTAAVAEGRVLSPEMVAGAAKKGALSLRVAWALLGAVAIGGIAVASQANILTIPPSAVPKPPEVLADRAREILSQHSDNGSPTDSELWFAPSATDTGSIAVRFLYRASPRPLIPANLFRVVTDTDPPADVPDMASITLDASGRLVRWSRTPDPARPVVNDELQIEWADLFREAGLDEQDFVPTPPNRTPLVPHDSLVTWTRREGGSTSVRVTGAALAGSPVYFDVADPTVRAIPFRGVFESGRPPAGEAALWLFIVSAFITMLVLARRNLRAGEGDRAGARKLSVFVICGGVLSAIMRAHHVPVPLEETILLLGVTGWALVWAGFSWLAYISFEPYVRRIWPGVLISWTRLLSGRWLDPLVGRDVLVGALGGVAITGMLILQMHLVGGAAPEQFFGPALESLRSARLKVWLITYNVLDGFQVALGGLFLLLLVRMLVRKTWIAVGLLTVLAAPLIAGGTLGIVGLIGAITINLMSAAILLRVGLLSFMVALICERLLTHSPITLDSDCWYLGSSLIILLLVAAMATYGFTVSRGGTPSLAARVRS